MKKYLFLIFTILLTSNIWTSLNTQTIQGLTDKYQSGQIHLQLEFILTIDNFLDHAKTSVLSSLSWNNGGNYYISDVMADNIKVVDANGRFRFVVGRSGKGPGDLAGPAAIVCTKNEVVVYETVNRRFSIFDHDGKFIKYVKLEKGLYVKKFAVLKNGNYIVERTKKTQKKKMMYLESHIELHSSDLEYIKTLYSDRVIWHSIVTKPKLKSLIIPFGPAVSWDIMNGKTLVVGCSNKREITIIDPEKNTKKSFIYKYNPIRITSEDKKYFLDNMPQITSNGRFKLGATQFARRNLQFPDFKPAFQKIICDHEGNILIFPYKKFSEKAVIHFDSFSNTGQPINRVKVISPERITPEYLMAGPNRTFWNFIERKEDLERVLAKFKVK